MPGSGRVVERIGRSSRIQQQQTAMVAVDLPLAAIGF